MNSNGKRLKRSYSTRLRICRQFLYLGMTLMPGNSQLRARMPNLLQEPVDGDILSSNFCQSRQFSTLPGCFGKSLS